MSDISLKESLLSTSAPGIELLKSMNLSNDELRKVRLNDFMNLKDQNKNTSSSTASSNSISHSNSMKKKQRKKLFTEERLSEVLETKN